MFDCKVVSAVAAVVAFVVTVALKVLMFDCKAVSAAAAAAAFAVTVELNALMLDCKVVSALVRLRTSAAKAAAFAAELAST